MEILTPDKKVRHAWAASLRGRSGMHANTEIHNPCDLKSFKSINLLLPVTCNSKYYGGAQEGTVRVPRVERAAHEGEMQ